MASKAMGVREYIQDIYVIFSEERRKERGKMERRKIKFWHFLYDWRVTSTQPFEMLYRLLRHVKFHFSAKEILKKLLNETDITIYCNNVFILR